MAVKPATGIEDNPSLAQQSLAVVLQPAHRRYDVFGWVAATLFLATITYFWTKMLDDFFVSFKE